MGLTEPKSRCQLAAFLLEGLAKIPFSSLSQLLEALVLGEGPS